MIYYLNLIFFAFSHSNSLVINKDIAMEELNGTNAETKTKKPGSYKLEVTFETIMVYLPYNCTLGCLVLLLYSFIIFFYFKQSKQFVPCMYLLLALFDCLTVVFMIIPDIAVSTFVGDPASNLLDYKWCFVVIVYCWKNGL